jgi:hypothetical protein
MPTPDVLDALDPAERERFAPVERIARELHLAELDLKDATDRMGTLIETHDTAEKYLFANFKPPTFRDLWLQSTTRPDKMTASK